MELNLKEHINGAFSWLMPNRCIVCGTVVPANSHPCCSNCYLLLPFQNHCCRRCGQMLGADQDYCGRCLNSPPPFDACFCPFRYEEPINRQIQRFKYSARPELARGLAQALFTEIQANHLELPEMLIPVPIHINRLRRRGYNQSLLLARELARLLAIPHSNKIIEKHRATEAQAQQTMAQRKLNVRNSFRLRRPIPVTSIAIIDDVITTGSTAAEITKILKRNGVDYVQVWGIAHTI